MTAPPSPTPPDEWQPGTSAPGEVLTPMGEVRAIAAFARGAKDRDPRLRPYRRSMLRSALAFAGLAAVVAVLAGVIAALT